MLSSGSTLSALAASGDTLSSSSASSVSSDSSVSSASSGKGTIIVEQETMNKMFGKWSLLSQTMEKREGVLETETAADMPAGPYTFLVDPPEGAESSVALYRGNEMVKSVARQQMTFTLQNGETLRVRVHHLFTRVGTVSVETDPPGVHFKLSGPNGQRYEGETPASYLNSPEGQYKVEFDALPGCVKPPPKSLYLDKDKRISLSLKISCDEADRMRDDAEEVDSRFVNVTIDGESVIFDDVPQEAWFAPYVFNAARRSVISGYRDAEGRPTGKFGPGNNVTAAELAKMAHLLVGIAEHELHGAAPENPLAKDAWFSDFIASAESKGWTIYADATIDPLRDVTRGEVLVTLLQAVDEPLGWQTGEVFTDVTTRTPYAAAIETAFGLELVSGKQDATGQDTGLFGPLDPINRAEMSKILDLTITTLLTGASSSGAK